MEVLRSFGSHFPRRRLQHLELGHQAVLSAEIIREQRDAEVETDLLK